MDASADEELRALRRRAYGPNADIHEDPRALDRLTQLELVGRMSQTDPQDLPIDQGEESPVARSSPPPLGLPSPDQADPTAIAPHRRSVRTRVRWLWAGSLIGAALIGAAAVTLGGELAATGDPTQVGTLHEMTDVVWPEYLGTETTDARGYTEFHGVTAITSDRQWSGPGTDTCLLILKVRDVTLAASEGPLRSDCGTTAFPATVQFKVTAEMPPELVERFPVGTQLQFALSRSQHSTEELQINVLATAD